MLNLAWQERASCFAKGSSNFFPEDEEEYESLEALRFMCRRCPVLDLCADHSLRYEEFGFWAGMTKAERNDERRRLGIVRRSIKSTHLGIKIGGSSETKNKEGNKT